MNELFKVITKEVFEEYQEVRECGVVNMADYRGVMSVAFDCGFSDLLGLSRKEYYALLKNYGTLKERYEGV